MDKNTSKKPNKYVITHDTTLFRQDNVKSGVVNYAMAGIGKGTIITGYTEIKTTQKDPFLFVPYLRIIDNNRDKKLNGLYAPPNAYQLNPTSFDTNKSNAEGESINPPYGFASFFGALGGFMVGAVALMVIERKGALEKKYQSGIIASTTIAGAIGLMYLAKQESKQKSESITENK